jgi:hypothetical protein
VRIGRYGELVCSCKKKELGSVLLGREGERRRTMRVHG